MIRNTVMQQPATIDHGLLTQITTLYALQIKHLTIYGPNPDKQAATKLIRLAPAPFLYRCAALGCTQTLAFLTNFMHFTTNAETIHSMILDEINRNRNSIFAPEPGQNTNSTPTFQTSAGG